MTEFATKQNIMRAAGLERVVTPEPLYLGNGAAVSGHVANVRSDTREVLGVVSSELVQNGEAFGFVGSLA